MTDNVEFVYRRTGTTLQAKTKNLTNHELRCILIGWWLTLDEDDKVDHIAELQHYLQPGSTPPEASVQSARAITSSRGGN